MSTAAISKPRKKAGRTPEEQAARDAREVAKAALPAFSPEAESAIQAQRSSPELPTKKRRPEAEALEELEVDLAAPEPLSKADARAARKKAKRADVVEDGIAVKGKSEREDGEAKVNGAAEVKRKPKKRNSIWIGNLSFKTTPDLLKDFVQRGVVELGGESEECVTRVNLPKKPGHGEFAGNVGYAYVDLATSEQQAMAVKLSERMLEGRRLLIKLGDDHGETPNARTPRPEKAKSEASGVVKKQRHPESATLFVGNLPFDATEEALRVLVESTATAVDEDSSKMPKQEDEEVQEKKGEGQENAQKSGRGGKKSGLRKVRLGAFEDTGRCKGFAFLDFYSPGEATKALTNRMNHYFDERKLALQYASVEATKRSGGRDPSKKVLNGPRLGLPQRKTAPSVEKGILKDTRSREPPSRPTEDEAMGEVEVVQRSDEAVRPVKDKRGKKWEAAGRPRPGAALAMAKREKVGIIEGKGEKIVFD